MPTITDLGFDKFNRRDLIAGNRDEPIAPVLRNEIVEVGQVINPRAIDFEKTSLSVLKRFQSIQSENYVTGVSGWKINMAPDEGDVEFADGIFRGTITATGGAIGGFEIGSDYIRDVANSFGLASTVTGGDDVRIWAGAAFADRATAPFRVTESGVATGVNFNLLNSYTANEAITALDRVSISPTSNEIEQTVRNNYDNSGSSSNVGWTTTASISSCKVTNTKFAQVCGDTAVNDLYVVAGTINNHTLAITYGDREVLSDTFRSGGSVEALYLEDDKVMFVYIKSDGFLYATVATLSGTDFTFGTEFTIYNSADVRSMSAAMVTSTTVAVGFTANTGGNLVRMQGLSVSGTTISAVANVDNADGYTAAAAQRSITVCHAGSGTVGMFYRTNASNGLGRRFTFNAGTPTETGNASFDATGGVAGDFYSSSGASNIGHLTFRNGAGTRVVRFSLSAASPSYGTASTLSATYTGSAIVGLSSSRAMFYGRDGGAGGAMFLVEILGTSTLSPQTRVSAEAANISTSSVYMVNSTRKRFVLGYTLNSTTNVYAKIYEEYDNSNLIVGIAETSVSAGEEVNVYGEGSNVDGFVGLSVKTPYFIDYKTSTLTTTNTGVQIGIAESATILKIKISTTHTYLISGSIGTASQLYKIYHNTGKPPKAVMLQALYSTSTSSGYSNGTGSVYRSLGTVGGLETNKILNVSAAGSGVTASVDNIDDFSITFNATVTGAVSANLLIEIFT